VRSTDVSIAIVYASKHGTTAKVAARIADALGGAILIDLNATPSPDLSGFDAVVVGGPVYAGHGTAQVKTFAAARAAELATKPLALFAVGMEPDPAKREAEIADNFPESLRAHALGSWFVGGEFLFENMGFFEKAIIKRIAHTSESVSAIDDDAISALVQAVRSAQAR
jgi:menaquinone-dependent protoporphyrinogen oxidase